MITSEEIKRRLWDGANELRGSMDASRYKDYMLGLMFYKFLSDKTLDAFKTSAGLSQLSDEEMVKKYKEAREEYGDYLDKTIQGVLGYYVAPQYLYQTWVMDISSGDFELKKVTDSLHSFESTIAIESGSDDFKGLFSSSTIDLADTALGSNLNERSKNVQALIMLFADLNMVALQRSDVLGDAYEYLIGQFAMESGKKAGEFYTPHQVSEVMAQIVTKSPSIQSIYDATVGSGSLLLTVGKHLDSDSRSNLEYYGQEKNTATYNLTRMNLLLHGVRPEKMTVRNADTLAEDWPEDPERPNQGAQFDAVVMNPPYSAKNWNRAGLTVSDPRFEIAGTLPPDSKGDYAFLLHGLFHLRTSGTMAIVLPHGVLFRGGSEGEIRKRLIDKNYIDTIIGLPSNLFTNTGIPVIILILKKDRQLDAPVLVIDASDHFVKIGKNNTLLEKHIAKIVDTYLIREQERGYSNIVSRDEILANDYNLNIPRYVQSKIDEVPHDVDAHLLGGIPEDNIKELHTLHSVVGDIIANNLESIRPGYLYLQKGLNEIQDQVLSHANVAVKIKELGEKIDLYISKYWPILINANKQTDIKNIMDLMLEEIKEILSKFEFVNIYDGYQAVADIWKSSLRDDLEIIVASDFYNAARARIPSMVERGAGKNKRVEQDGWVSSLIPNGLIATEIFSQELSDLEKLRNKVAEIESQLDEFVFSSKIEGTEEYEALHDCLSQNKEGEPGNSFTTKAVRDELKLYDKNSKEYELIMNVQELLMSRIQANKDISEKSKKLEALIQERILILREEEIDDLMQLKWFSSLRRSVKDLIERPIIEEIEKLRALDDRYKATLTDIDEEYQKLEENFNKMLQDLVVTR